MKALKGDIETIDSKPRTISEDQYWKKRKAEGKVGKYERVGLRVSHDGM